MTISASLLSSFQTGFTIGEFATGQKKLSARAVGSSILWSYLGSKTSIVTRSFQILLQRSGCLSNSFSEDTLVSTIDGLVPIKNVEIGSLVLSYNEEAGLLECKPVIHVIHTEELKETLVIELGNKDVLRVTPEHLLQVDGAWISARNITVGQTLQSQNGAVKIVSLRLSEEKSSVYNISVADNHNYFVGQERYLVHNTSPCEQAAKALAKTISSACKEKFRCNDYTIAMEKKLLSKDVKGKRLCVKSNTGLVGPVKNGQISKNEHHSADKWGIWFSTICGRMAFCIPNGSLISESVRV